MARNLGHIEIIKNFYPIKDKDRIVIATMENLGWSVIVQKDQFVSGDKCVYFEIDSVLPLENPDFEFLGKKHRIKTMKMGGVVSQGIIFPMSILPGDPKDYKVGQDVTDILGVTQYEPEMDDDKDVKPDVKLNFFQRIIKRLKNDSRKDWPKEIHKTDETRIEALPWLLEDQESRYIVTEKLEGCSGTFLLRRKSSRFFFWKEQFEFIVCSKNLRFYRPDESIYWQIAEKYKIKGALRNMIQNRQWICIQGECVGPQVQKNRYHVTEPHFYAFNVMIPNHKYDSVTAADMMKSKGIDFVPILDTDFHLPDNILDMQAYAHGESKLFPTDREGVVVRTVSNSISFKSVAPIFLINLGD